MGQGTAERRKGHHWEALNDLCSLLLAAGGKPMVQDCHYFIVHFGVASSQDEFNWKQICCSKGTCGGAGGVRSPSGGWSSSSHRLIFPQNPAVHLQAWQGEEKTLTDPGDGPQKAQERCEGSSSSVAEHQNDFLIIPQ